MQSDFFLWHGRLRCGRLEGMKWVLFYDGDCAFCTKSVNRIFDLDRRGLIDFAPLQGELARTHDLGKHADRREGSMVVLRESDGAVFLRSDAILELARALGGIHRVAAVGRWIPRWIRDGAYRWIARNRHRLGGADGAACRIPSPAFLLRLRQ